MGRYLGVSAFTRSGPWGATHWDCIVGRADDVFELIHVDHLCEHHALSWLANSHGSSIAHCVA